MIKDLPEKLKSMRKKSNLSQKEVGEAIGVSVSTVSDYEIGNKTPSVGKLLRLAGLYRCSVDYLLSNEINKTEGISIEGLTVRQVQIVKMFADELRKS